MTTVSDQPAESRAADAMLSRLRAGDEVAFHEVVTTWSPGMLRLARMHVSTDASAQEVVQEAWLAVLRGLATFEGRSSLRTWVTSIVLNVAKSRGVREGRVDLVDPAADNGSPTVDPDRFRRSPQRWARHWTEAGVPQRWDTDPARGVMRGEVRVLLEDALRRLPTRQREVVVLRDVEGLDAEEVCTLLGLDDRNQRVLLHRGRAKVRALLEDYYRERDAS